MVQPTYVVDVTEELKTPVIKDFDWMELIFIDKFQKSSAIKKELLQLKGKVINHKIVSK